MNKQEKATLYEPTEGERVGKRLGGIVNTSVFVYVYTRFIFECIYLDILFTNEHVFCFGHTIMYIQKKKKKMGKKVLFLCYYLFRSKFILTNLIKFCH